MPVTVRELIVRATVVNDEKSQGLLPHKSSAMKKKERDALLNDCVEKVLELLEREKER